LLPLRPLGSTDLKVPPIGFGGAVIGIPRYLDPGNREEPEFLDRATQTVHAALAAGITYFDTAAGYGSGRSERILGEVLEPHRDKVTIATKIQVRPEHDPESWWDGLRASLDRLRTDHVDLLQLHGKWLAEVKARGLARYVGVTAEVPSGGLEDMLRSGRFDVLQIAYSIIYQAACDYQREPFGPIPLAKSLGIGVTTMRTTTSGVLYRLMERDFPEADRAALTRMAIRYVLSSPHVDCALIGMSNPAEVEANAALAADEADRWDLPRLHNPYDLGWDSGLPPGPEARRR
jgi:uncharacterized protein